MKKIIFVYIETLPYFFENYFIVFPDSPINIIDSNL